MAQKTLENLNKNVEEMKNDIALIKNILIEEYQISEQARKDLEEARKTPLSDSISHKELKKQLKL